LRLPLQKHVEHKTTLQILHCYSGIASRLPSIYMYIYMYVYVFVYMYVCMYNNYI